MKKQGLNFCFGVFFLLATPYSMADSSFLGLIDTTPMESNFSFNNGVKMYAGGSLGYSEQSDSCNAPFFDGSCEDGAANWKLFGGARINPVFGVELSYHELGDSELNGESAGRRARIDNEVSGYQVSALGYLPVARQVLPNLELIGRAGLLFWERDTKQSLGNTTEHSRDDGVSPVLGMGVQYQLNQNLYLRGEWEHMFSTGSDSDHETDVNSFSAGLMYSTL